MQVDIGEERRDHRALNLPVASEPGAAARLAILADRLGNWAQMLAIAKGWLRARVEKHERLADAIARFERRLVKDGPFVFDPKDEPQRNTAIRLCIAASVENLDAAEATRVGELAILPGVEPVEAAADLALGLTCPIVLKNPAAGAGRIWCPDPSWRGRERCYSLGRRDRLRAGDELGELT
jgi:hypothetical protein